MPAPRRTLAELLADARDSIARLSAAETLAAAAEGALIVDIRSDANRERDGVVPGSLHVPRTVLEWRFAPDSATRSPHVGDPDRKVIVLCDHGYSSSLAAASLVELGFDAGDVVGGFEAWLEAGLPVAQVTRTRSPGALAGMEPPEP